MVAFDLTTAQSLEELSNLTSNYISDLIRSRLKQKDRVQIALSGGSTPCDSYLLLRQESLSWDRVDVLLGDERWVSQLDESSNALMLRQTLLASGPGAKACFHPTPTLECDTPEDSANKFSKIISDLCKGSPPVFDLILLGLGEDGDTASLFPGTDSLNVKDAFTTVGRGKGLERITLTANVISAATKVIFLVSGESKQVALKRLLDPDEPYRRTPARLIRPDSEILIFADRTASKFI